MPPLHICVSTLMTDPMGATAPDVGQAIRDAASAGYDGISLWTLHHLITASDGTAPPIAEIAAAEGLQVPVVEAMAGWANATDDAAVRGDADFALGVADAVGATLSVAVCMEESLEDRDRTVASLRLAADVAADAGVALAIEFLPWTAIPTLRACADLVGDANRDNVGILLDSWHWHRQPGGPDHETLRQLPGEWIRLLQLSDAGPPTDDLFGEAMTSRLAPGAGSIDFAGLLADLDHIGATPILSPEVFNTLRLAEGAVAHAEEVATGCRAVLVG